MVGARNTVLKHDSRHSKSVLLSSELLVHTVINFLHSYLFHTHTFTTYIHHNSQNTLTSNTQASIPAHERNCEQGVSAALIIHCKGYGRDWRDRQFHMLAHCHGCGKPSWLSHPVALFYHPVTLLSHPVTLLSHPVTLLSHPVALLSHPVTLLSHPVTLLSHPVALLSHPVTLFYHPVTLLSYPVTLLSHPVARLSHPVTLLSHPVTLLSHPVTLWVSHPSTDRGRPGVW